MNGVKSKKASPVCISLTLSIVFAACLFGSYLHLFVVGGSSNLVCIHGKWTLYKTFTGPGVGTVTNIEVLSDNTILWGPSGLPTGGIISVSNITSSEFPLTITWTDWRGPEIETVYLPATPAAPYTVTVTNTIPTTPTWMQTAISFKSL
jgi:hypothetical protein